MIVSDPLLQFTCAGLVLLVPLGLAIMVGARRLLAAAALGAGAVSAVTSLLARLIISSPSDLAASVLDAAAAGAFAVSFALLLAQRYGARTSAVVASLWSVLIYQPVFWVTVITVPPITQTVFGAVDFAAVFATHVSAAAAAAVFAWRPARGDARSLLNTGASWPRASIAAALLTVGASAWMLGLERVASDSSGRIALNSVAGLLLGAGVWLIVSQIAARWSGPRGLVAGVIAGWASVGAGVAFLSPAALVASVVLGTAAATAVVVRAGERSNPTLRTAVGTVVAVVVGGTVLAILADGFGMSATGSVALVAGQLGAVIAVLVYSMAVALLCRLALGVVAKARSSRQRG